MITGKCYLFRALDSTAVSHRHLHLAETQGQGEELENCTVGKEKVSGMPPMEAVSLGKL